MRVPDLKNRIPPQLPRVAAALQAAGVEVRLVGGAVRDILAGKTPKDFDLASPLPPEDAKILLENAGIHTYDTGIAHGTVTAVVDKEPFEITTLRRDVSTDGRRATVAWSTSWREDAERRDLTINAMSLALDGTLYDYFGGHDDLRSRRIRFVGDADTRIREDHLRSLRYFRFMGRWPGAQPDPAALAAIRGNRHGLDQLSGERIWMEMSRILVAEDVTQPLNLMRRTGVLRQLGLPDDRVDTAVRAASRTRDPVGVLVAMIGARRSHEEFAEAWRWSTRERRLASFLERHRDGPTSRKGALDLLVDGAERHHVAVAAELAGKKDVAAHARDGDIPVFPVSGKDLIALGCKPGPDMGKLLGAMKETWKRGAYSADRDRLLEPLVRAVGSGDAEKTGEARAGERDR